MDIKIRILNEKHCRLVQELLFRNDYIWIDGDIEVFIPNFGGYRYYVMRITVKVLSFNSGIIEGDKVLQLKDLKRLEIIGELWI